MAEQIEPGEPGGTPVPDLIERYRLRRDAWMAQADELARLRDEVRSTAEREAMEIVTHARGDVRRIITEARRELLVLSAQVQAALGEGSHAEPPAILGTSAMEPGAATRQPVLTAGDDAPAFAAEQAVDEILNEVQADISALEADARALPPVATGPARLDPAVPSHALEAPAATVVASSAAPPRTARTAIGSAASAPGPSDPLGSFSPAATVEVEAPVVAATSPATPLAAADDVSSMVAPTALLDPMPVPRAAARGAAGEAPPSLSEAAARALLSSPVQARPMVTVQNRPRTWVIAFGGVGLVIALLTTWWYLQPAAPIALHEADGREAPMAPAAVSAQPPAAASEPAGRDGNLSVVAEALREVWVRTTVDGSTDGGRTLAAGQRVDLSAERTIALRVGDAGALVVSVNRGEKRPLGRDGEVVTRQFTAEPAPVPSRTPAGPVPPPPSRPAPPPLSAPPTAGVLSPPPPPLPPAASPPLPSPSPTAAQIPVTPPAPPTPVPARIEAAAPAAAVAAGAPAPAPTPAAAVVTAAQQWLDAYQRGDRAAMAALSMGDLLLADERRPDEKFPAGLGGVTRTLDRVSVQIAADTAVLTAVMTEQSGSALEPRVSPVSQVWVLAGGGQWRVRQARFVSEARLNQVFR